MSWLKRKPAEPVAAETAKRSAPLSGGSKVLDIEQQQQSRERMEEELAQQRANRG